MTPTAIGKVQYKKSKGFDSQIITPLRNVRLVTLSLLVNFVLMPLAATGLATLLRLDDPLGVGLLLLGSAAGAPFLPKLAQIVRGELAFAVGLMVLLMVVTVGYLPLVQLGELPVAIPNLPYYIDHVRTRAPALKLAPVDTIGQIEASLKRETFDALVMPAESGSVLTLLYPKFTVVVPEPEVVKIPLAYPVARRDQEWAHFVNIWIELKRRDGTIDALYRHWILGKQACKRQPRWSIMRNVLHWVE